jgi:DNA-binding SARP family transcriptional activator
MLEFRILGPLEVVNDGAPVPLGGAKQRATLTILLLNANTVVSVDRLADDLYSGAAPATAVTQVQRQISELRKVIGDASAIETRSPGYALRISAAALDLHEFELLAEQGSDALAQGDPERAAAVFRQALALWRGEPLADVGYEDFAQRAIQRLEQVRLNVLEQRLEADLARGRHADVVGELEELTAEHPAHERFHAQLMLALYRAGRQVEALAVYKRARSALLDEFGIEPGPALQAVERAVLTHDSSLDLAGAGTGEGPAGQRVVVAVVTGETGIEDAFALARPLLKSGSHELIVAGLVEDEAGLASMASALNERRIAVDGDLRVAAFTTSTLVDDALRLVESYGAELLLVAAPPELEDGRVPAALAKLLERSAADVGLVVAHPPTGPGAAVYVPFGGSEHDWAALELGAWLAAGSGEALRLVGARADRAGGRRDASRLLADAAVAVQRVVGVETEPLLVEPWPESLLEAVEPAAAVVVGISSAWRREGIGPVRRALVREARAPTVLVHRGPRPGVLAPRASSTRFTWTIRG